MRYATSTICQLSVPFEVPLFNVRTPSVSFVMRKLEVSILVVKRSLNYLTNRFNNPMCFL